MRKRRRQSRASELGAFKTFFRPPKSTPAVGMVGALLLIWIGFP